ncbi:MAG: hypothetical protein NTZ01_06035 [Verrucomicrobia bacterium]|nr:hypothetical protein [Verrucomicrobiota bacterium]
MKFPRYLIVLAALAAVAGMMFLYNSKDWLVRSAVVKATEDATGVSVHLGSLRIELTRGDGLLKDFRMGNPKGFSNDELLSIQQGKVTLDIGSVTGPVIRIKTVEMEKVSILFEGSGKKNNMKALEAQVNERSAQPKGAKEGKAKKIRIDSFVLKNVKLDVRMSGIVKAGNLDLGDIRMSNLGGANGATASEIAARISNEISSRATTAVIRNMVQLAQQMGMDVSKIADGFGVPTGVIQDAAGFFENLFK